MNIDKIVQDWKEEIESINIDGFSKKISNIDINRLIFDNDFKITFDFERIPKFPSNSIKLKDWSNALRNSFQKFGKESYSQFNDELFIIHFGGGDNYILYQGHRFIVQFNMVDFISNRREEVLNNLLDDVE